MTPDFSALIAKLTDAGFEFVIIGGYAAVTHGSAQVTRDLDLCAVLTDETIGISGIQPGGMMHGTHRPSLRR